MTRVFKKPSEERKQPFGKGDVMASIDNGARYSTQQLHEQRLRSNEGDCEGANQGVAAVFGDESLNLPRQLTDVIPVCEANESGGASHQQHNRHEPQVVAEGGATCLLDGQNCATTGFGHDEDGLEAAFQETNMKVSHSNRSSSAANAGVMDKVRGVVGSSKTIQKTAARKLKRGPYMCKLCRGYGHTAKTCNKRRIHHPQPMHNALHSQCNNAHLRVLHKHVLPQQQQQQQHNNGRCMTEGGEGNRTGCANKAGKGTGERHAHKEGEEFLYSLRVGNELRRRTPKEQLYLHYESVMHAIYQLSTCAYRAGSTAAIEAAATASSGGRAVVCSRARALQALRKCLQAEQTVSECMRVYHGAVRRVERLGFGADENRVNVVADEDGDDGNNKMERWCGGGGGGAVNSECMKAVRETKECVSVCWVAMKRTEWWLRRLLFGDGGEEEEEDQEEEEEEEEAFVADADATMTAGGVGVGLNEHFRELQELFASGGQYGND